MSFHKIHSTFTVLSYSIQAAFLVLAFLILTLLCLPIYVFRYIVKIYFKKWKPEYGKILDTRSSMLATDDLYNSPTAAITIAIILDGEIDPKTLEQVFIHRILNSKNGRGRGDLCYPELKQYIHIRCGLYFWKNVENFAMENYISVYNGDNSEFHEKDLQELINKSLRNPFPEGQSPWSMTVVNNFKPINDTDTETVKTAVLFRYHHALADGYAMLKLMNKLQDNPTPLLVSRLTPKHRSCRRLLQTLLVPIVVPYRIVKSLYECYDVNPWHLKTYTTEVIGATYPKIPVCYLKRIQEYYQVSSISAVIFAAYAGAIRRAMMDRGAQVPEFMHCVSPLPVPEHPDDKLRNYATVCAIRLPVGTADAVERLRLVDKYLVDLKDDPTQLVMFSLWPILGGLFPVIIRPFIRNVWTTLAATSFPGFKSEFKICGIKCLDMVFAAGFCMRNQAGIGLISLSYNGNIRFGMGIENKLLKQIPNPSVPDILEGFAAELHVLHDLQPV